MSGPHFARMPPGDRAPHMRWLVSRHLTALEMLTPGPASASRIAAHRRALGRLARTAARLGIDLPPAVAARAARVTRRAKPMSTAQAQTSSKIRELMSEDLDDAPLLLALRTLIADHLDRGAEPGHVVDALLQTAAGWSIAVRGSTETALALTRAGSALALASPELAMMAAESIRTANAAEDRLGEMRSRMPRADH